VIDQAGRLIPVEIKSGATLSSDWYDGLRYFTELQESKPDPSYLVYGGREGIQCQGTQVLSWADLDPLTKAL
jgi:hypothetical protein